MYRLYRIAPVGCGHLFASAMPDAANLQGTLDSISRAGVRRLVCMLESEELKSLGLRQLPLLCSEQHIEFTHFPVVDYGTPPLDRMIGLVEQLYLQLLDGNNLLIHCRGGIGRSGTLCCCLLIAHGFTPAQAIAHVSLQRGESVPETDGQRQLIESYYRSRCRPNE